MYYSINSRDIQRVSDGEFVYTLPCPKDVRYLTFVAFKGFADLTEVHEPQNTIIIDDTQYTITPGHYSLSQLLTEVSSVTGETFTFDAITMRVSHTGTSTGEGSVSDSVTLLTILGFPETLTLNTTALYQAQVVKKEIYVSLGFNEGTYFNGFQRTSFTIMNDENRFGYLDYRERDYRQEVVCKRSVAQMNIRFHDHRGRMITVSDFVMILRMKEKY